MRAVFVGASTLTCMAARLLVESGHEVVIIEKDEDRVEALAEELDCGLIHGDGSRPSVLEDVSPEETDILLCLTNSDQDNIIASLVGRELDFPRIVTRIDAPEYEHICLKLGLENPIVPDREIARLLESMVTGREPPELTAVLERGLRMFAFVAREKHVGRLGELELPEGARPIALTRGGKSELVADDTDIAVDDEILLLAEERCIDALQALKE